MYIDFCIAPLKLMGMSALIRISGVGTSPPAPCSWDGAPRWSSVSIDVVPSSSHSTDSYLHSFPSSNHLLSFLAMLEILFSRLYLFLNVFIMDPLISELLLPWPCCFSVASEQRRRFHDGLPKSSDM